MATTLDRAAAHASTSGPPAPGRLAALDVFRGATIAGMLLVNNPGSWAAIHPPLRHAEWHGWTPTDLIFPFFLFIVGVSLTFSFAARRERGAHTTALLVAAARRAAILFVLGLLLHAFPSFDPATLRIPGVLQRIALAYLAAAALYLLLTRRALIAAAAVLLLGYWALLTLIPVPGGAAGVLEPGADLGAYIDRAVFGTQHLWSQSRTWDPEGLLSTLPAIGTVLLGSFAGEWLRSARTPERRVAGLLLAGIAATLAGVAWGSVFPINKNLWTSSYALFTAGIACMVLALCYWLVDVKEYRRAALPFTVFGMNAIAAFFLSSLTARILVLIHVPAGVETVALKTWLHATLFVPYLSPRNASLAFALCYVLLWLGIMSVLHRRRIFIKV